jgi:branched-chain amino acid transport system substrate-binding protein
MYARVRAFLGALVLSFVVPARADAAPSPAGAPAAKGQIRVGLLAATSGPFAGEGGDIVAGFRYFLATHGDRLGGFRVDLRTGDEGPTVDTALAVAHQLVEQDAVDVIVGVANSDAAYGIADYIDDRKKPLVIAGAGADELTQGKARKTLFRVQHTSSQDVMPLGNYACRKLHVRRVALVAADYTYGWESAGGFARTFTDAGCRIVQEQYVAPDGADFAAAVAKIDRSADGVFAAFSGQNAVKFVAAYRDGGLKVPLLGTTSLTDERFLNAERESAVGIYTGAHYAATLPNPDNIAFRLGYQSLEAQPVSSYAENGYVAAQALADALSRVSGGPIKADAVLAELRRVQIDAPRGPVRFDDLQQAVNDVFVRRVRQLGGRWRNDVVTAFSGVSQFWKYDPKRYLAFPTYAKLKGTWARP